MTSVTTPVNQEPAASIPPIDAVPAPYQPSRFARLHNRLIALPVFLGGAAVLGVASRLQPNPAGLGTHRQLGLPPCQFEQVTGIPCATCGCTTSFSHAANGSLLDAFLTQPFGGLLALMTAMAVIVSGYALVSNMPVMPLIRFISRGRVIAVLLVYMMLAWGYAIYQHVGQAHAVACVRMSASRDAAMNLPQAPRAAPDTTRTLPGTDACLPQDA